MNLFELTTGIVMPIKKYVQPAAAKAGVRVRKGNRVVVVKSWNLLNVIIPSYGRHDTYLPQCLKSIVVCTVDTSKVVVTAVLHRGDTKSADAVAACLDGTGIRYEILWEDTTRVDLPVYFNLAYERGKFGKNNVAAVQSMVGDDMVWKTRGWERILLGEINKRKGVGTFYCAGQAAYHSKLCVNLWVTPQYIRATGTGYFMPPQFPADMIDVVWQIAGELSGTAVFLEGVVIYHDHTTLSPSGVPDASWMRADSSRREACTKFKLAYQIGAGMASKLISARMGRRIKPSWNIGANGLLRRLFPTKSCENIEVVGEPDNGDKVISYMMWGEDNDRRYRDGITYNLRAVKRLYPGWRIRVHTEARWVGEQTELWQGMGAEIVLREGGIRECWSLVDLGDERFCRVLLRDADSHLDKVEADAVAEWVESGIIFHTIRDHRQHSTEFMVGLTGSRPRFIGAWYGYRLKAWDKEGDETRRYGIDTDFLTKVIYPVIGGHSLLVHDDTDRFQEGALKLKRPPNWPYFCGQRWIGGKPQVVK